MAAARFQGAEFAAGRVPHDQLRPASGAVDAVCERIQHLAIETAGGATHIRGRNRGTAADGCIIQSQTRALADVTPGQTKGGSDFRQIGRGLSVQGALP
jgi:hypothetical protein